MWHIGRDVRCEEVCSGSDPKRSHGARGLPQSTHSDNDEVFFAGDFDLFSGFFWLIRICREVEVTAEEQRPSNHGVVDCAGFKLKHEQIWLLQCFSAAEA